MAQSFQEDFKQLKMHVKGSHIPGTSHSVLRDLWERNDNTCPQKCVIRIFKAVLFIKVEK